MEGRIVDRRLRRVFWSQLVTVLAAEGEQVAQRPLLPVLQQRAHVVPHATESDGTESPGGGDWGVLFGSGNLKSNPMWPREAMAVRGNHGGLPISVMVRTNRRDELVAALRTAGART